MPRQAAMPVLILTDGTKLKVEYNTAAKVLDILNGTKEPENKQQADFANKVVDVQFDTPRTIGAYRHTVTDHDEEMDKILSNPRLRGRDKLKAVVDRIRERARV